VVGDQLDGRRVVGKGIPVIKIPFHFPEQFFPGARGLGLLFQRFTDPDQDPVVYYVLVDQVAQARALLGEGVDPLRVVALAEDDQAGQRFRALGIPGVQVLLGDDPARAIRLVSRWLRVLHGVPVRLVDAHQPWAADAPRLLQQVQGWLAEEGWAVTSGLTVQQAEAIARINGMA